MPFKPPLVAGDKLWTQAKEGIAIDTVVLNPLPALPPVGTDGQIVCLDTDGSFWRWAGGTWVPLAGAGSVTAEDVTYVNAAYPGIANVKQALDQLLYVSLTVPSFTNDVGTVEIGTTVTAVNFNWSYNKAVVSQTFNASPIAFALRALGLTGLSLTSDTTYTVVGNDGTQNASRSTSVLFRNKRFWGVSATPTPTGPFIDTLSSSEFATSRNQSRTFNCAAQYIYVAWPSSFGNPTFTVNGLLNTGFQKTTVSYTNSSGHTSNYDVWRSGNLLTGSGFQVVIS